MSEVRMGDIARCSQGHLGLITSLQPQEITYPDGTTGMAWTGIHLEKSVEEIGADWSSRQPQVVKEYDSYPSMPFVSLARMYAESFPDPEFASANVNDRVNCLHRRDGTVEIVSTGYLKSMFWTLGQWATKDA